MKSHIRYESIPLRWMTASTLILGILMLNGLIVTIIRFTKGLATVTNLDNLYAWGIWKAVGVASFVAVAAGGFTSVALLEIFHRRAYRPIKRTALLLAMFGYTGAVISLFIDLGRYYNIWHPILPSMWSPHSALFEVAMCVMTYLMVLYFEFIPVFVERFRGRVRLPGFLGRFDGLSERLIRLLDFIGRSFMPFAIVLGVVLSLMHQSALGSLMMIASTKMHPLWFTPALPLFFLLSAIMCGFPSIIVASHAVMRSAGRRIDPGVFAGLSRIALIPMSAYGMAKLIDLNVRGRLALAFDGSIESTLWLVEMIPCLFVPIVLFLNEKSRKSPTAQFAGSLLIVLGVVLNRINVYLTAFTPPSAGYRYFPSPGEISITLGLLAGMIFLYRLCAVIFPIVPAGEEKRGGSMKTASILIVTMVFGVTVSSASGASPTPVPDCALCHSCALPTRDGPCLKSCPRDRSTPTIPPDAARHAPASIRIDYLTGIYDPVHFDHTLHATMPDTACTRCHHHSSQPPYPACKQCHAASGSDAETGVVNLRGAFHRQCLGCHRELNTSSSCETCHRVKPDQTMPSTPQQADEVAGTIPFDHSNTRFPLKAYHRAVPCIECHRRASNHHSVPTNCEQCHPVWPEGFRHEITGIKLDEMHGSLQCAECHTGGRMAEPPRCDACHDAAMATGGKLPGVRVD